MDVKIQFFSGGYSTHREAIVMRGGSWKSIAFPAVFAVITHPRIGIILYDTGYSARFFEETRNFPARLYAMITPVVYEARDNAAVQLKDLGIDPADVKYIITSHFHADHVGGLKDFPNTKFICSRAGYESVKPRRGLNAVKAGFLAGLIPNDFEVRALYVENQSQVALDSSYAPFQSGYDIFKDGSCYLVDLPGHVVGQLGLFITAEDQKRYFLIADACWVSRAYQELRYPHPITQLITSNYKEYQDTLQKIYQFHRLHPEVIVVPTHCNEQYQDLASGVLA